MDATELRARDTDELHSLLKQKREEYTDLKFKRVTDVIENPSRFQKIRKDIARILTILNERNGDGEKE